MYMLVYKMSAFSLDAGHQSYLFRKIKLHVLGVFYLPADQVRPGVQLMEPKRSLTRC